MQLLLVTLLCLLVLVAALPVVERVSNPWKALRIDSLG